MHGSKEHKKSISLQPKVIDFQELYEIINPHCMISTPHRDMKESILVFIFGKKENCVRRFFFNKIILGQLCVKFLFLLGCLLSKTLREKKKRKPYSSPKKPYHFKEVYWYSSLIFWSTIPRFSSNVEYNTNDVLQMQRLPNFDVVLHSNFGSVYWKISLGSQYTNLFFGWYAPICCTIIWS